MKPETIEGLILFAIVLVLAIGLAILERKRFK